MWYIWPDRHDKEAWIIGILDVVDGFRARHIVYDGDDTRQFVTNSEQMDRLTALREADPNFEPVPIERGE